jgi:hypothetical protein
MRNTDAVIAFSVIGLISLEAHADAEQSFDVADFTRVAASQGVEVNITMGSMPRVTAIAETEKDFERLEIEVDDGELRIRRGSWSSSIWNWGKSYGHVSVNVVAPKLEGLSSSSGANLTAVDISCEEISIDASSGSRLDVSGRCEEIDVDASSGASIEARNLEADRVVVDASSGANVNVFAAINFQGDASSGANVDVYGTSQVFESDTSSGARINRQAEREPI